MLAIWVLAFRFAVQSIQIHSLTSQRQKISYAKPQREAVSFNVVSSSTVATYANINVILTLVINLSSAASLVSAFTVTVATFVPGKYIVEYFSSYLCAILSS